MEYGLGALGSNGCPPSPRHPPGCGTNAKCWEDVRLLFMQEEIEVLAHSKPVPASHSSAAPANPPSPGLFFQTVNAFQRTAAIKAAVDLDVFTGIAEGKSSAAELAGRCGAAERGV